MIGRFWMADQSECGRGWKRKRKGRSKPAGFISRATPRVTRTRAPRADFALNATLGLVHIFDRLLIESMDDQSAMIELNLGPSFTDSSFFFQRKLEPFFPY